jgi:predicted RNA binding protein YcfA (HicA-like mRNA interferase family)
MLPRLMLKSPAWLSLTAPARAIYVELECRHFGTNNGDIGLSVRDAATLCRIAKDTAAKAFQELQEKGFIRCRRKGSFHCKVQHASEWELTAKPFDSGKPTNNFMQWQPGEKKISRS